MDVVLIVEPDNAQAEKVRRGLRSRVRAELVCVKSAAAAIEVMDQRLPDLILLSALLSPRDEDQLMSHLRSLDNASHLQTVHIPQLSDSDHSKVSGALGRLRKKKKSEDTAVGCDPRVFANEIVAHLARAAENRGQPSPSIVTKIDAPAELPAHIFLTDDRAEIEPESRYIQSDSRYDPPGMRYDSPIAAMAPPENVPAPFSALVTNPEPVSLGVPDALAAFIDEPSAAAAAEGFSVEELPRPSFETPFADTSVPTHLASVIDEPAMPSHLVSAIDEPAMPSHFAAVIDEPPLPAYRGAPSHSPATPVAIEEDSLTRLARQVGLDPAILRGIEPSAPSATSSSYGEPPVLSTFSERDDSAERVAAEVAQVHAEAQAKLATEIARVRAEAEERRREELARLKAEADTAREAAIAEARATEQRRLDELARLKAEADAAREAAIAEARAAEQHRLEEMARQKAEAEARAAEQRQLEELTRKKAEAEKRAAEQRRLDEIARLKAEADAAREAAIADARAAAEREAREAMAAEIARVRSEAEGTFAATLTRVQNDANQARLLVDHLSQRRAEADRLAAEELARVRAEAEEHLKTELHRIRGEADRARAADQSHAKRATEQIREAAAREARAAAEREARDVMAAEIARVRSEADALLETEIANARAEAQERQASEMRKLQAHMESLRQSAAEEARAAAVQAVASDVTRKAGNDGRAGTVIVFPASENEAVAASAHPSVAVQPVAAETEESGDYYHLWKSKPAEARQASESDDAPNFFRRNARWIKWAIPAAASLVIIANTGPAIIGWFSSAPPAERAEPAKPVSRATKRPVAAAVAKSGGDLKVESTPAGAEVVLNGRSYGKTPLVVSDLEPGTYTMVLRSNNGVVGHRVTIRAGETTAASESIFSGWLAIFSPIPLNVLLNGKPARIMDDGRIMASPGTYQVELANDKYNYRASEQLEVKPGEVTAHTVMLPAGTLRINAPDGADIRVDGNIIGRTPLADVSIAIGTHEISATHPELGSKIARIDVRFDQVTEAKFDF